MTDRAELHIVALLRVLEKSVRHQVQRDGYDAVEDKLRGFIFDREHQPVQYRRVLEPDWAAPSPEATRLVAGRG